MRTAALNLTNGKPLPTLLRFVLPFLLANILQVLYGTVDLYVVGQFDASEIVSAVSIGTKVTHMITVMILGIATGASVQISMHIGEQNPDDAAQAVGNTIILFSGIAVLLTPIFMLITPQIVALLQTPPEATEATIQYVFICACGIPFIIAYNVLSSIYRATGDSQTPLYFILIACIVNIGLDFFLIGGLHLHAAGAALATIIAQAVSFFCGLLFLKFRTLPFTMRKHLLRPRLPLIGSIVKVGVPLALQDGFIQVSFLFIIGVANLRGVADSAAVGIVETIIGFLFLVPSAFLSALTTITAQNLGANQPQRATQTTRYGIYICMGFGGLVCLLCQWIPELFVGLFTDEANVLRSGIQYLRSYSIDCFAAGFTFCVSGYLCGCSRSGIVFLQNVLSAILIRIPLAYGLSRAFSDTLFPMGIASPAGSLFSLIFYCIYFLIAVKKKKIRS